jgi:hypothetical protein
MSADLGLERALADLGAHLEYPPTPPLAEPVLARIAGAAEAEGRPRPAPPARPLPWSRAWPGWRRRRLVAVAVALLLLLAALLATPAVARRVGLRGITVHLGGPTPTVTSAPAPSSSVAGPGTVTTLPDGGSLALGRRVTLAQARAEAQFTVQVPTDLSLGPPDAVYLAQDIPGGRVSLVWRPRPGLPASRFTGIGLLLTEFSGEGFGGKVLGSNTQVEEVTVAGAANAFWITGAPHTFFFQDKHGQPRQDTVRLAGPTLIWQSGQVTLRLEGNLSKRAALRIANSTR